MKLETAAQAWESFRDKVIPPDAPEVQVTECRRAFYAGCWAVICTFRDIGGDAGTEDAGVAHVEALYRECRAFQQRVLRGEA